jgi:hypothetical protein
VKKSFYTKTLKAIENWTGEKGKEVDTSNFRYAYDLATDFEYKGAKETWNVRVDYTMHNEDGSKKPVAERNMNIYLTNNVKNVEIHKSIYLYAQDDDKLYSHRAQVDVRANSVPVAYNFVDIDLVDYDGKFENNFDDTICGLIFRP